MLPLKIEQEINGTEAGNLNMLCFMVSEKSGAPWNTYKLNSIQERIVRIWLDVKQQSDVRDLRRLVAARSAHLALHVASSGGMDSDYFNSAQYEAETNRLMDILSRGCGHVGSDPVTVSPVVPVTHPDPLPPRQGNTLEID